METRADATQLLAEAARVGYQGVDTAPAYGDSEAAIGATRWNLEIHTKLDPDLPPAASLERSLRRLRRDRVAVLYFHTPGIATSDPAGIVAQAIELVGDAVGRLGVSVYDAADFAAAVAHPLITVIQAPISVLDRRLDLSILADARNHDVQVYARSVLFQGLLTAPADAIPRRFAPIIPSIEAVRRVADAGSMSPLDLAVRWVRDLPGMTGIVVGAQRIAELNEVAAAWKGGPLAEETRTAVDALPRLDDGLVDLRRWTTPS